jgi:hypothetical protein
VRIVPGQHIDSSLRRADPFRAATLDERFGQFEEFRVGVQEPSGKPDPGKVFD